MKLHLTSRLGKSKKHLLVRREATFSSKSGGETEANNDVIQYPTFKIQFQHIFGGKRSFNRFYNEKNGW
jgi:hypothetical protein